MAVFTLEQLDKQMEKQEHIEKNQDKSLQRFAFVYDINMNLLSPTKEEKAWFKVRHNKAKVLSTDPLVIQLQYPVINTDDSKFHLGIDPGETTGICIVQECKTHNKPIFKAELNHRKNIHKLMQDRAMYRRLRHSEKRYRKPRFDNRASSRRSERLAPSIKASKDEILRLIQLKLSKYVNIHEIHIEDVQFDIRALTDDYKPNNLAYQLSNRLDENLRLAAIKRDQNTCKLCGATNTRIEVHHITPRRQNGLNTISNLICLCSDCHKKVTGQEDRYKTTLYHLINTSTFNNLRSSSNVQIGKNYLYKRLGQISFLTLTNGADTANRRYLYNIEKTHSNDAACITNLKLTPESLNIYEYQITPIRRRSTHKHGKQPIIKTPKFKLKDKVKFTKGSGKNKTTIKGIIKSIKNHGVRYYIETKEGITEKPEYKMQYAGSISKNLLVV